MLVTVIISMGLSLVCVMVFGILLVYGSRPWYDVKIVLPAIALLLNEAVEGTSKGLSTALQELTSGDILLQHVF